MAKKKICTTNPARKLRVGKTDLSGLPTMSDEFACAMERECEPTEEEEKALLARQYEIAEMIRERSPRVPVGGDGVIHVDYGVPGG